MDSNATDSGATQGSSPELGDHGSTAAAATPASGPNIEAAVSPGKSKDSSGHDGQGHHQSESLEDDEPSSDDLRPVPTHGVAAAAAQSD
jgi:hypothetical protein